ncbi:transcriptional regulator [Aliikangiella marina]|uniref:Transcriptional regulator n=1 Tax=Aliikangiella marina TaxID=1712262 RepID=A0A545T9V6_9GAMM|nr:zinc ribbon domain-containing protein [Aliikangiella marina]TQV73988.1 transcriptional regulator [Aliikangiella marina]
MSEKINKEITRCQSCGMPMSAEFGNFGTEADGASNFEFCSICYQSGHFVNPNQTLAEMIASSVDNMTCELGMPVDQATQLANDFIPTLKRWR